ELPPAVIEAFNRQAWRRNVTLLSFTVDDREGKLFAEGTIDATAKFIADPRMLNDSHHWFRYSLEEVNEKCDRPSVIGLGCRNGRRVSRSGSPNLGWAISARSGSTRPRASIARPRPGSG